MVLCTPSTHAFVTLRKTPRYIRRHCLGVSHCTSTLRSTSSLKEVSCTPILLYEDIDAAPGRAADSDALRMATHIDSAKSAKSYLPHIPVEVYEHIVASGPLANTLTCALVCRTLYHRSRYLSLETIYLRDTPHVFQLSKYIRKHAQYRRAVKTVHIVGGEGGTARHLGTFAATCAPLLPAAGTLVIRGVKWGAGQTHQDIFQHLAILQGVVALTLKDIELPSPASLASLLRAFPALASLSCEQVRIHQYAKGRSALSTKTAELGLPWPSWCTQFALYADDVSAKPLSIAIGHGRRGLFDTVLFSRIDVDLTLKCLATSDLGSLFSSLHGPRLLSFRLNIDCRGLPSHLATHAVGTLCTHWSYNGSR